MAIATNQDRPPTLALAIAGYGAALGSLFPIVAVMTTADISGGLSIATDSAALVNTMQNIGAIVGLLIAPTFAFGIGRGRMMVTTGTGFLLASAACALAPSLGWMLAARVLHGVFGGILPFLFMLLVMTSLKPGPQRFGWMVLFASSTSLFFGAAAAIGGWLVDQFGWRALFWAQAFAVVPYVAAASTVLRTERGKPGLIRSADWSTHITLSIGLSMILFALSEGERHFWIETWWVPALLVGGSCATAFALRNLKAAKSPLLNLTVFRRATFSWGIILSLFFRFGQMFAVFVVPQYLARLQGFRAADTGRVLLIMMPATALALTMSYFWGRRLDSRWLLSSGLACFAIAAWQCTTLASDWATAELSRAAITAGFGMGFFSVAVLRFATFGANLETGPTVGVVFNLTRVFGIVSGLAILSHIVVEREKFHSAMLGDYLGSTPQAAGRIATTSAAFARFTADADASRLSGIASLGRAASGQAFTLAFGDGFTITAIVLILGAVLVWALPPIPTDTDIAAQGAAQRSVA